MCGMEQRNPQETSSVPEPLRRHSAEHRRCGTEGSGPPAKMTPGCGFVSYDLRSRCAYVCGYGCAFIRVRTGSSLSPGKGSSPQAVPPVTPARPGPRGHGCLMQRRRPELHPPAGGSPAGRRKRGKGRRAPSGHCHPQGCLSPTLPNRLRHLVCCMPLSLSSSFPLSSPLPIPPFKSQALQGEDAGGKWDQLLLHALGFVHSPSCTTCTLSAPLG